MLAVPRNMPTSPAWPSLKSSARVSGLVSMSTTSTEVSGALTLSRISFQVSFPIPASPDLPARRPRRACRPISRQKLVVISSITLLRSATAGHTFASTVFPELARASSPFRTPSSPTSLHPCFGRDTNCPLCGQPMDKWGDHALV